jgi:gliding motility-associated-like protein
MYTVVVSNVFGCTDTEYVEVFVFPDPIVTISDPVILFIGESTQLFANAGIGSAYQWTPSTYLDDAFYYSPLCVPDSSIIYAVAITTSDGCKYYDSTEVVVLYETLLQIPNAFTPNGDGLNDLFQFVTRGPFDLELLQVFNRWGKMVFSTFDAERSWDGTVQGIPAEVGTYVYYLKGTDAVGAPVVQKGNLVLLR